MDNKIIYGIIGVISLLAGFGGNMLIAEDQFDNAYVCSVNENLGVFDRLSSTSKTGYYVNELGEDKRSTCRNGFWIPLKDYVEDLGITPTEFLQKIQTEDDTSDNVPDDNTNDGQAGNFPIDNVGAQYECSPDGCTKIR